ncbi:MAG: hypothetical protein ACXWR1_03040 [Bdellovibrionota bacterium]
MAAKRRLELTPTLLEEESPESGNRRIELTTKSGKAHKEFSVETGTVVVDDSGLEEFRKREEAAAAERTARTREHYLREEEKLRNIFNQNSGVSRLERRFDAVSTAGKFILIASVVYFGALGIFQLFSLAFGRPAPNAFMFLAMAAVAGVVLCLPVIPPQLYRTVARLGYAFTLIYFGVLGVIHLVGLWRHPPAVGVSWRGFGYNLVAMAATVIVCAVLVATARRVFRFRARLVDALDNPDAPLFQKYTFLENRDNLCMLIYAVEGCVLVTALLGLPLFLLRDPILLTLLLITYPYLCLFYLYPFFIYIFYRKLYLPQK